MIAISKNFPKPTSYFYITSIYIFKVSKENSLSLRYNTMLTIPTAPSEKGLVPRYSSLPLCCFSAQVAKEVVIFFSSAVLLAQVGQSPRCHQVRDLVGEAQKTITEALRPW